MDYVVGSVAALISGNVTPNRPKLIRRALTPTKHQPSPNVTPKSEIEDRSIFLSPTLQKKKAVVKKSPKRIFQNQDSDTSEHSDGNSSPKPEKVKKHLKNDLEGDKIGVNTSKKKKKQRNSLSDSTGYAKEADVKENVLNISVNNDKKLKSPQSERQRRKSVLDTPRNEINPDESHDKLKNKINTEDNKIKLNNDNTSEHTAESDLQINKKKKKKSKAQKDQKANDNQVSDTKDTDINNDDVNEISQSDSKVSPKKRNKRKKAQTLKTDDNHIEQNNEEASEENIPKKKKKHDYVNPNAISHKESDSEHDSDNEIESENEQINNELLKTEQSESSDEEEEEPKPKKPEKKVEKIEANNAEEVKRTLFVGNVPFSGKCKKEIKKIFSKYGQIETIRIRTVPVKDARVTPKLAVIKNELHPDRSTVNVYIKYADSSSVSKALVENNTVLKDHHLRVSRSDTTGVQHDPNCSVFVGNMPFALEDETLRSKFENCGEIESVRIIRDKKSNAGKGFGYVNFKSRDGVELALALSEDDLTIKNRILRVKRCIQGGQKTPKRDFSKNNQNKGGFMGKNQGDRQRQKADGGDGALRRIKNKRPNQDSGDGPPNKREKNIIQPNKEKKVRKEFVGMTSEKKKKQKFNKGQKKKKALSEILTKKV